MSLELSGTTPAIKGVAGSVSAPALTGEDANTGISFPAADTIKFSTNGVERMSITNSGVTGISGGKILQVEQTFKSDTASITTIDTWTDITGTDQDGNGSIFCVKITPSSASNKILVTAVLNTSAYQGSYYILRLEKDGTPIATGDALGSRSLGYFGQGYWDHSEIVDNSTVNFLDTAGSTSAITYNVAWYLAHQSGSSLYLNRCQYDANQDYAPRMSSTITAMEIDPT